MYRFANYNHRNNRFIYRILNDDISSDTINYLPDYECYPRLLKNDKVLELVMMMCLKLCPEAVSDRYLVEMESSWNLLFDLQYHEFDDLRLVRNSILNLKELDLNKINTLISPLLPEDFSPEDAQYWNLVRSFAIFIFLNKELVSYVFRNIVLIKDSNRPHTDVLITLFNLCVCSGRYPELVNNFRSSKLLINSDLVHMLTVNTLDKLSSLPLTGNNLDLLCKIIYEQNVYCPGMLGYMAPYMVEANLRKFFHIYRTQPDFPPEYYNKLDKDVKLWLNEDTSSGNKMVTFYIELSYLFRRGAGMSSYKAAEILGYQNLTFEYCNVDLTRPIL